MRGDPIRKQVLDVGVRVAQFNKKSEKDDHDLDQQEHGERVASHEQAEAPAPGVLLLDEL